METGLLELETLHPGGLETTRELARLCNIQSGDSALDVACGTGQTACFLAETLGARVHGIDYSEEMIRRAGQGRGKGPAGYLRAGRCPRAALRQRAF